MQHTSANSLAHAPTRLHGPQGPPSRSRAVAPRPETLLHRLDFVDRARGECASAAGGIPGNDESHAASCRQLVHGRPQAGLGGHGTTRRRRFGGREQGSNQVSVKIYPTAAPCLIQCETPLYTYTIPRWHLSSTNHLERTIRQCRLPLDRHHENCMTKK